jgi:hypothetical protein
MGRAGHRPAQQRRAVAVVAAEIGACTKGFSLCGQDQRAAIWISVERLKRGSELFDQRDIEKIVRRPPDFNQRHMAGLFHADIVEGSHAGISRVVESSVSHQITAQTGRDQHVAGLALKRRHGGGKRKVRAPALLAKLHADSDAETARG